MSLGNIRIRSGTAKGYLALASMLAFVLLLLNADGFGPNRSGLLFTSPALNYLAAVLTALLPSISNVLLVLAASPTASQPPHLTKGGALALLPFSLFGLVVVYFVIDSHTYLHRIDTPQRSPVTRSTDFVHDAPGSGPPVRAYYSRLSIRTDYIVIQQERPVLPGLIWVTPLDRENASTVVVTVIDRHHLRCVFASDYSPQPAHTVMVENP